MFYDVHSHGISLMNHTLDKHTQSPRLTAFLVQKDQQDCLQ